MRINERKTKKLWDSLPPRYLMDVQARDFPHRGLRYKSATLSLFHHWEGSSATDEHLTVPDGAGNEYIWSQIEETFTREEMLLILDYFIKYDPTCEIMIKKATPPKNKGAGIGAMAVGGNTDFYMFDKDDRWNLPFGVWGYFDVGENTALSEVR